MRGLPHANYAQFRRAIQELKRQKKLRAWTGDVFRYASPEYGGREHFLSGRGAQIVGARWNAPATFRTLYTSTTPETATGEAFAYARRHGFPDSSVLPLSLKAIAVDLSRVLDLTDPAVLSTLGVTAAAVRETDWDSDPFREALTQAIGRAAYDCRVEAILAPSARLDGGFNLVIFPERVLSSSTLKIHRRERAKRA